MPPFFIDMTDSTLRHHIQHLLRQQQLTQAHQDLLTRLQQNPEDHLAWSLMAEVNAQAGDLTKAVKLLDKALTISAQPEYVLNRGKFLYLLGRSEECHQTLQTLDKESLTDAGQLDTLANLYSRLGDYHNAHGYHLRAAQYSPDNADILVNAAISHNIMAANSKAKELLQRALQLTPNHYRAHYALAEQSSMAEAQAHIEQLTALLAQEQNAIARQHLFHALALEHELLGDYAEAFNAFANSKEAVAKRIHFDAAKHRAFCQQLISTPPQLISQQDNDAEAVFVAGMPRSGTTLVAQLLCQSPHLASLGELQDFPQGVKRLSGQSGAAILTPEVITSAGQGDVATLAKEYLGRYRGLKGDAERGCDKLPFNFYYIDFIVHALPQAKIVLMLRAKEDTCIANFRQAYQVHSPFHHYAFTLWDIAAFYDDYERLARHFAAKYPENVILQSYEDLVSEGEPALRRLYAFCQLPWQDDCLQFYTKPSACATASKLQIRRPLNKGSVGYWRHYQRQYEALVDKS
ncbi:sulfotransferase [Pseudoalteromonas sp. BDTF-M6]|uniref:tetratricopeptide repeat-containing sulfotransferase family protein n=1 Tax=Pseudoalteromonas sp. BDTF-M6 TaxID=2796132 RepID=UPI001BB002C8|nr:sulfotransferase [Pseudoalteromonas sp. BDTF-M6]MBS3797502.1 sulfotransferase [Pseudoalteromonas sp. BDTF-M6]